MRNQRSPRRRPQKSFRSFLRSIAVVALLALLWGKLPENAFTSPSSQSSPAKAAAADTIHCKNPFIIDGDTLTCANVRIRLAGIDAPEMPDHCRKGRRCTPGDPFASKAYLQQLSRGPVDCQPIEIDSYGRTIAQCQAAGRDLSCAMIEAGHAAKRYRPISCD